MTKKIKLNDRFFVSNQNFTTEQVKIIKNSIIFRLIFQNSRFSDKVADLLRARM